MVEQDYGLKEKIGEVIKVFGTSYGDFLECLLAGTSSSNSMLEELTKYANFNKVSNLFEVAVRQSTINDTPLVSRLSVQIKKFNIYQQIYQVSNDPGAQEALRDLFRQDCILAETFVLHLEMEQPLNILVDADNLLKYQVMFRMLFYVKFVENQLSTTWQHNQKLKGIKVVQFFCQSLSKSINFVKGLLHYLTGLLEEYTKEFFLAYD